MNTLTRLLIAGFVIVLILALWIRAERGRLLLPSTWKFMKAAGIKRILNFSALNAYVYGRWSQKYLKILGDFIFPHFGKRVRTWWINRYHGKVLTLDQAKQIINLDHNIPLQDLEQIIPYKTARNIVMEGNPELAVYDCICRSRKEDACEPRDVCLVIGQPIVDFLIEHQPVKSRRITQQEALDILDAEHKRGHMHTAWFKDAMLDRFYSICNCCKCCCLGVEAMVKYDSPMITSSGYVAEVDSEKCTSCKSCEKNCIFDAIQINDAARVNWEKCMGCGVCVDKCKNNAIKLTLDEKKGKPFEINLLH